MSSEEQPMRIVEFCPMHILRISDNFVKASVNIIMTLRCPTAMLVMSDGFDAAERAEKRSTS